MIKFDHVGLRYGTGPEILSDISFTLKPGAFHFLTGPSGAGKTSLLKLLYLGIKPTRGAITMFNKPLRGVGRTHLAEMRRDIGVVFQDFRLLNHLNVYDNIALPLKIRGMKEKNIRANVDELMEWVDLSEYKHAKPETLSGGQQQRIAIARAVVTRPRLILADEPTGNLDDKIGYKLMHLFEQLNRMGTTVMIATHNKSMMEDFGHARFILDKGNLIDG